MNGVMLKIPFLLDAAVDVSYLRKRFLAKETEPYPMRTKSARLESALIVINGSCGASNETSDSLVACYSRSDDVI